MEVEQDFVRRRTPPNFFDEVPRDHDAKMIMVPTLVCAILMAEESRSTLEVMMRP